MSELLKKSGEYFVAGELERRGFMTSLDTKASNQTFTIVNVHHPKKHLRIEVKVQSGIFSTWDIIPEDYQSKPTDSFYIFIRMNYLGMPDYYIVPAEKLLETLKEEDSLKRIRFYENSVYHNAWDLLEK